MAKQRDVGEDRKLVAGVIDETLWIALCEEARSRQLSPDHLHNALLYAFFVKTGRIKDNTPQEKPLKAEWQLEPILEDEEYLEALVLDREAMEIQRQVANKVIPAEGIELIWEGL